MKTTGLFIVGIIFCGAVLMGAQCVCKTAQDQVTAQECVNAGLAHVEALRTCRTSDNKSLNPT
jgi:hypothetical protein